MDLQANRGVTRFMFINCVCCQSICTPLWPTRGQVGARANNIIIDEIIVILQLFSVTLIKRT